ncbi:hypothetical protein F2P81_011997 [Scophthalmus maximus]|uniref:Uncharacterized protein n=1 Tax=Scophthalmus maximus TaxID=52904 RepID=A0A6A4SVG5_SCOMX|nr:hypothetical protein F2P81_011997 [Scophthalmus maximus]
MWLIDLRYPNAEPRGCGDGWTEEGARRGRRARRLRLRSEEDSKRYTEEKVAKNAQERKKLPCRSVNAVTVGSAQFREAFRSFAARCVATKPFWFQPGSVVYVHRVRPPQTAPLSENDYKQQL